MSSRRRGAATRSPPMMDRDRGGDLPPAFLARLARLVPSERLAGVLASFACERWTGLRMNSLVADPVATLETLGRLGFTPTPVAGIAGAQVVPPEQRRALTETELWRSGAVYIQNPASQLPPLLLDPGPADRVLDLAAAPGSKTLQLAALMANQGWISAVEAVRERFFRLRANLERHGARNVHTYHKDGARVWHWVGETFDTVLLDAPCSSEGQFSRLEPRSFSYWSEHKIRELARKQQRLLFSAVQCLKPGGTLVYATCTLAPEENEAVVDAMLRTFAGRLRVEEISLPGLDALPGLTAWGERRFASALRGAARILPSTTLEGFFLCRLRKDASTLEPR
jgi:tRNA (cytosine49-C5)-methyltransferase